MRVCFCVGFRVREEVTWSEDVVYIGVCGGEGARVGLALVGAGKSQVFLPVDDLDGVVPSLGRGISPRLDVILNHLQKECPRILYSEEPKRNPDRSCKVKRKVVRRIQADHFPGAKLVRSLHDVNEHPQNLIGLAILDLQDGHIVHHIFVGVVAVESEVLDSFLTSLDCPLMGRLPTSFQRNRGFSQELY